MKQILRDRSTEPQLPSSPQLITTPTLWHLGMPFEGKANAGENALIAGSSAGCIQRLR